MSPRPRVGERWELRKEKEAEGRGTVAEDKEETEDNTKEREHCGRKSDPFYNAG